ncbi:uncharacterized protein LOC126370746 isoform X2 [Pectinophora gossypiella]|uniref:uncharacterized protein LOC126370746 isoform X2 n=1 Tax=Pectinophora gossypiella TaxID=13191 RepID=UPI00214F3ED6|nr:uncharacterized protein LOC126370746 isoform X2 [Pectinophora gossypiella]
MTEWLFDIFGDRLAKESTRSLPRQPLSNNENIGKAISTGPIKPNEPLKKAGEPKKSFLSNAGRALRDIQTPGQKVYSPRSKNVESAAKKIITSEIIYSDELDDDAKKFYEELEFTKPTYKYGPEPAVLTESPPRTPPPVTLNRSLEFDCSYEDEFFTDNFAKESGPSPFGEDDFPTLYTD